MMAFFLLSQSAVAQVRVRGLIVDESTGEALPYATVQIASTTRGTVSNASGQFVITISRYPTTLDIRYIGYLSVRVEVTAQNATSLVVRLSPAIMTLDEVVVTGDNPADQIIRRVLAAKERMFRNVRSFYADTYTRFMLYSEFDLVQMNESVRAWWWTPSSGGRELIRAERSQPARSGTFAFASPHHVVNFYDDDIDVLGTRYAGPLHPNALDLYVFTLGPVRRMDGQRVYDIYFTPRSPTRPSFSGHMAVLDSVFAVLQISARPHPGTVVTPPIERHDVYMEQRFFSIGDSVWVPLDLVATGSVSFGRAGVSYPTARYEQVSGLSLHVVNPPVPDSMAVPGPGQLRHPLAGISDELFARNPSFIPLTPRQVEQLVTLDPSMTLERAFPPIGLLSSYAAVSVREHSDQDVNPKLDLINRIVGGDWLWYNRVDGWHPGLGYGRESTTGLSWRTSLGYSTERKRLSHQSEVSMPWQVGSLRGIVGVSGLDATSVVADVEGLGRFVPGMATYLGWDDLYDYYEQRRGSVFVEFVPAAVPMLLTLRANSEVHSSLEKRSDFNGWLFRNVQRENPLIAVGDLRSFEIETEFGNRESISVDFLMEYTPGSAWGSDFTFRRYSLRGSLKVKTFYRRRSRPNWLRVSVLAGTSSGDLPVQRQFSITGSAGPFSEFTSFRSLGKTPLLANDILGIFWTHDFTTAVFEKLGLWRLADGGMGIQLFGGHGFSSSVNFGEFSKAHHEFGIGLSYPFGLPFRLDFATTTSGGFFFRFGKPFR